MVTFFGSLMLHFSFYIEVFRKKVTFQKVTLSIDKMLLLLHYIPNDAHTQPTNENDEREVFMNARKTVSDKGRVCNTDNACIYADVSRGTLYKFFKPAMIKIGRRTVWDKLVLDQILDALRREGEVKDE